MGRRLGVPTQRQRETLALLDLGWSNSDIGKQMGISVETVKRNVQDLMDCFQIDPRTRLNLILTARARASSRLLRGYHCQPCGRAVLVEEGESGPSAIKVKTRDEELVRFDYVCPSCEKVIRDAVAKAVASLGAAHEASR